MPSMTTRPVNLALQGGGAHGAFTWGVLDAILADGRLEIAGVSGTSAGAMNAVALAAGLARGGREGARRALAEFWHAVGRSSSTTPWTPALFGAWFADGWTGPGSLKANPAFIAFDIATRFLSPYEYNPLGLNPLENVLRDHIDFDAVKDCRNVDIFVSATNVWNGRVRVFGREEITAEAVMASACLPHLFRAVEIDGIPYWDGGYMGNPSLFPFFSANEIEDVLLIQINPVERRETPRTAREIIDRMNEITFNASLLREFRAIEFVSRLIDEGVLDPGRYRNIRMHRVGSDTAMSGFDATSKFNADPAFLDALHDAGRAAGALWLDAHADDVGERATLDLRREVAYTLGGEFLEGPSNMPPPPKGQAAE